MDHTQRKRYEAEEKRYGQASTGPKTEEVT